MCAQRFCHFCFTYYFGFHNRSRESSSRWPSSSSSSVLPCCSSSSPSTGGEVNSLPCAGFFSFEILVVFLWLSMFEFVGFFQGPPFHFSAFFIPFSRLKTQKSFSVAYFHLIFFYKNSLELLNNDDVVMMFPSNSWAILENAYSTHTTNGIRASSHVLPITWKGKCHLFSVFYP